VAGRLGNCRYCRVALVVMTAVVVMTILNATRVWQPWPAVTSWWDHFTALADPEPSWNKRLGAGPDLTAILSGGDRVVTSAYDTVAAYDRNGQEVWKQQAYWALTSGDVVVLRQRPSDRNKVNKTGYVVIDADSGTVLWGNPDATGVWVFANRILDLACPKDGDCVLRARTLRDNGLELWHTTLPARARTLSGPNPGLVTLRDPAGWFAPAAKGIPPEMPGVIGLRVDAGTIEVIDTVAGTRVRELGSTDPQTRISVAGDRVLVVRSRRTDLGCRYSIEGRTWKTDTLAWQVSDVDLKSGSGTVCEQRSDPMGAGGRIIAIDANGAPMLIDATDGSITWKGAAGASVLATDGKIAVLLRPDRKTVDIIDLIGTTMPPRWTATLGLDPVAAVTPDFVVIEDQDARQIIVLDHNATVGELRERARFTSRATVCALGNKGLLVGDGRRIGYIKFT
jgi:hypothetical protein